MKEAMKEAAPTPAPALDPDRTFHPGDVVVGTYVIERALGQGGMGTVYLAADQVTGQKVAVKVLPASLARERDIRERFVLEARALATLDHPNIVPLVTFAQDGDERFLVMKYVAGESLEAIVEREGVLSPARASAIVRAVCDALDTAHKRNVIHRDIKPTNILIDSSGGAERVVIVDFGIARTLDGGRRVTETGMLMGTPQYMSPEQIRGGTIDGRADLYACGLVLFEMLAGTPPFDGHRTFDILRAHVDAPVPDVDAVRRDVKADAESVPPSLRRLLHALLEKDPNKRPASARDVVEYLDGIKALADVTEDIAAVPALAAADHGHNDTSAQPEHDDASATRQTAGDKKATRALKNSGASRATSETPANAFADASDDGDAGDGDEFTDVDALLGPARNPAWKGLAALLAFGALAVGAVQLGVFAPDDDDDDAVADAGPVAADGISFEEAALIARGSMALSKGRVDDAWIAVDTALHLTPQPSPKLRLLQAKVLIAQGKGTDSVGLIDGVIADVGADDDVKDEARRLRAQAPGQAPAPSKSPSPSPSPAPSPVPSSPPPTPALQSQGAVAGAGRPSTLPEAALDAITSPSKALVSTCFTDHVLLNTPDAAGDLHLKVRIQPNGTVGQVTVTKGTLKDSGFRACVMDVVKQWRFSPFPGRDDVILHSFRFRSAKEP
jgi:serine/threonine-protein kinase